MQKTFKILGLTAILGAMISTNGFAADYKSMTTEELAGLRGTMQEASSEDRAAFRDEWQSRSQQMSTEEKQQYSKRPASASQDGTGSKYRKGNRNGNNNQASMGYSGKGGGQGGPRGGGKGGRR